MRATVLLLLVSITLANCRKDSDPDPLAGIDKTWLDATIADIEKSSIKNQSYIVKADYDGTCLVFVSNCCPDCATALIFYRCDNGTRFDQVDTTRLKDQTTIWKPENFECLTTN